MITLHHLEYSQSFRVLWLLEELQQDYELRIYERDKETYQAPPALKDLSPLGSAPVITDDELVLAESNAIVDYLLDQHPDSSLRIPPGNANRVRYLFWVHAAQGSMMSMLIMEAVFEILKIKTPLLIRPLLKAVLGQASSRLIAPRLAALLTQAEKDLDGRPWFGGDALTAADIVLHYPMASARSRGYLDEKYPRCLKWLQRAEASPGFLAAREKDGRDGVVLKI